MIRVILNGACGRMGRCFATLCENTEDIFIVAGVDENTKTAHHCFPVYDDIGKIRVPADVIVDFSAPASLNRVLRFAIDNNLKLLVATTGHSPSQLNDLRRASEKIAVFKAANLSVGIWVLSKLAAICASTLSDFDVAITETHHKNKLDAPSGTALMLKNSITSSGPAPRTVGINSIRGGTVTGKHEVVFLGNYETITITHEATCKDVYASGAIRAIRFLSSETTGFYTPDDLFMTKPEN
ncbi:MAG: 4-hydroxy-tetrahydrodipicolinate reductase [Eubacteriales bacterium]|nr:4-hydroxy-tetrahydrodipicolinate reductase [Christensenellaceae bacterium]MDY2751267.1 4-hydroxy-tetrahydrodipicolinate reductase [Eubacteriales bacterium]